MDDITVSILRACSGNETRGVSRFFSIGFPSNRSEGTRNTWKVIVMVIVFLFAKKEGGFEENEEDVIAFLFARNHDDFEENAIAFFFAGARKILRDASICKDFEEDFEDDFEDYF